QIETVAVGIETLGMTEGFRGRLGQARARPGQSQPGQEVGAALIQQGVLRFVALASLGKPRIVLLCQLEYLYEVIGLYRKGQQRKQAASRREAEALEMAGKRRERGRHQGNL